MITAVLVPDVGATGADVRLAGWLVKEGERVAAGAPLFVLETDKATHDVEAFRTGYLRRILAPADARVEIGAAIALLSDAPDEPLDEGKTPPPHQPGAPAKPEPNAPARTGPAMPARDNEHTQPPGRVLASPLARRLAGEHGLDVAAVPGSGPQGQIHKRDVLQYLAAGTLTAAAIPGRRVPLSAMRRAVARRTQLSKSQVPHFYAEATIDLTDALELRERLCEQARGQGRAEPSVNDLVVHAAAKALGRVAELNASFQDDHIFYYEEVVIGVAMAVGGGVMVPVLRAADCHNLGSLAATTAALRTRAEAGQLTAADLSGGALTVSNLGMFGLDRFTAVINPPQAAVLAVGAARPRPAVHQGRLAVRTLLDVTLSLDHRVADGVAAARFLAELRGGLEEPRRLLENDPRGANA